MSAPSSSSPLRLLLIEDSEVVRTGLKTLLGTEPALVVVGEAATVAAGIAAHRELRPDVVLLDLRLPDGSGLDACREILRTSADTRVLVLTSVIEDRMIDDAIRAGASGYLLKEIDGAGLVRAIREVAAGHSILDPALTARVIELVRRRGAAARDPLAGLSEQEKCILELIAAGCTNREIAARLDLAEKTVRNSLSIIFDKLQVSRRTEAAAIFAREHSP